MFCFSNSEFRTVKEILVCTFFFFNLCVLVWLDYACVSVCACAKVNFFPIIGSIAYYVVVSPCKISSTTWKACVYKKKVIIIIISKQHKSWKTNSYIT